MEQENEPDGHHGDRDIILSTLRILSILPTKDKKRLARQGDGRGFPGIPLKRCFPALKPFSWIPWKKGKVLCRHRRTQTRRHGSPYKGRGCRKDGKIQGSVRRGSRARGRFDAGAPRILPPSCEDRRYLYCDERQQ